MSDQTTQSESVQSVSPNPYTARVIGFVDNFGQFHEEPLESGTFNLLINVGEEKNVSRGDTVLIFALGPALKDPETGEDLGAFEIVRGEGSVSSVQARMAVVTSEMKKTERRARPQNAIMMAVGAERSTEEITVPAPFRGPQIGDLVRFI